MIQVPDVCQLLIMLRDSLGLLINKGPVFEWLRWCDLVRAKLWRGLLSLFRGSSSRCNHGLRLLVQASREQAFRGRRLGSNIFLLIILGSIDQVLFMAAEEIIDALVLFAFAAVVHRSKDSEVLYLLAEEADDFISF